MGSLTSSLREKRWVLEATQPEMWHVPVTEPEPCPTTSLEENSDSISLYAVKEEGEERAAFGILCGAAPRCSYRLHVDGTTLLVECKTVPWDHKEDDALTAQFHLSALGTSHSLAGRVVLVDNDDLDRSGMRSKQCSQAWAPAWVKPLMVRCKRLLLQDQLSAKCAPVAPMPSPLALEVAFGGNAAVAALLSIVGRSALRLLAVTAAYARWPLGDAGLLDEEASSKACPGRVAYWLARNGLLRYCATQPVTHEQAVATGEALLGVFLCEKGGSSLVGVVGFWRWLLEDPKGPAEDPNELGKALVHLGGAEPICGQTPTYTTLQEQVEDGIYSLEVYYEDVGPVRYRIYGARGQEFRVGIPGADWEWIEFDRKLETLSPTLRNADGSHRPLPNKIFQTGGRAREAQA